MDASTSAAPATETFSFLPVFAAFACCSGAGLSIDNPQQSPSFYRASQGPDLIADELPFDRSSSADACAGLDKGHNYSPPACIVPAPFFGASYVTEASDFAMLASGQFSEAPEPSALTILCPAVLGLGLLRRRSADRSA
jgi:hypothetical protein